MIISLPLTLLIYQLVAAFGVLGLTALIVRFTGTDFQLMFLQGPIDKMRNWKRFKNKTSSKLLVVLFTVISIVIVFLPTLLALATELIGDKAYYYTNIDMYSQQDPYSNPDPPLIPTSVESYPPFDDFSIITWLDTLNRAEYEFKPWIATESIVQNYLYTHFGLPFSINAEGVWYGVLRNLTNRRGLEMPDQTYYDYDEYQRHHEAPTLQKMDATTGTYRTDNDTPTYTFGLAGQNSFSLHKCDGQLTSNLPDFENHQLLAVSNATAGAQCYPQFDTSLPITVQVGSTVKKSVLDDNDRVFRTARFNMVSDVSSAISVSAMYLNDTFVTMAIKKTAHITYHSDSVYWADEKELLNCSSANLEDIYTQEYAEYNRLNHTKIMCQLKSLSQQNPGFNMLQATHRSLSANFSVNSVYTYSAPTIENTFGGMAIDLTWFTTYTLESPVFNFPKGQEFLIAHVFNDRQSTYLNRNLEALITHVDVFGVADPQNPVLPNLVKIQAALKARSTYYFSKSTASVHLAYDIANASSWVLMVAIPGCVFFLCACLAARQRKKTLRSCISACQTVEQFDDVATLVVGRKNTTSPLPSSKPTKLSLCHESATTQAGIPVLLLDGKSILLQQ